MPAFIPSDSPDSPAKDEAGAEGEGGRELCPCAVTPHGDPGKGQRSSCPRSPHQGCGVTGGCAVPLSRAPMALPEHPALSCSPCPEPGSALPPRKMPFPCCSPQGEQGLHPSPASTLGCGWVGVISPRQFLPCLPVAFSLWDGLSQLDQPQRGIRRWCEGGGIAPNYPWGDPKLWGAWVRAGAKAQSCAEHLLWE